MKNCGTAVALRRSFLRLDLEKKFKNKQSNHVILSAKTEHHSAI